MMRILVLTLLVLGSTLLVMAPTASACDARDPTNVTDTCLEQEKDGDPTCPEDGWGTGRTDLQSDARGFAQIHVHGERHCSRSGEWSYHNSWTTIEFTSGETTLRYQHYEWSDSWMGWCFLGAHLRDPATGHVGYEGTCPYGVLSRAPWGGL